MAGILIKYGLSKLLSFAYVGGSGVTPPHLYFQSAWLGAVLNMAVNNSSLRWTINEGNRDGVKLWSWLKFRYESAAKSDPLRRFYGEKIRSLNIKYSGLLGDYIKRLQGLEITWIEINTNVQP